MNKFKMTVLATLAVMAVPAFAAMSVPSGIYVEGNFGASTSSNTYGAGTSTVNAGTAWNLNGGYKFFPMLGVEAGVTSYSNNSIKNSATSSQFAVDRHWAYDLALKGMLPVLNSGIELFAKAGAAQLYASTRTTNGGTIVAPSGFTLRRTSHISPYYGGGVAYYFTKTWAVNAQWMRANGNSDTGRQNLYTGGLTWMVY